MSEEQQTLFHGRWLHSHEEDTPEERVYRHASFPFPPSRGRSGFELRADRTCRQIGIAARDGSTEVPCTWALVEDGEQQVVLRFTEGEPLVLQVVSISPDRLVIRR